MTKEDANWGKYFIPNTNVLKNKLGITDYSELKEKEKQIVRKKLAYLYLKPIEGNFDFEHLKNIHKFIFGEIYPFAGEVRTCTLQKDSHIFCDPNDIEQSINELFINMNNDFNNNNLSKQAFAYYLSKYYYDILYIHPFREGNGRSVRCFFRDFVVEKSKNKYDLDYTKMDAERLILGTSNRYIYFSYIETEFMNGLVELKEVKENIK